jgi:hypothetical protein
MNANAGRVMRQDCPEAAQSLPHTPIHPSATSPTAPSSHTSTRCNRCPNSHAKIADIAGATVYVFPDDHPPRHVHVRFQGVTVRLRITDALPLEPAPAFPPRVLRDVRSWLLRHRDEAADACAAYHP